MRIRPTHLAGLHVIEPDWAVDSRGRFARTFCEDEFRAAGLIARFVQCNVSVNEGKGILRGMHFQADPRPEGKLVRCTRGAIFDVALDLRPGSPTFKKWYAAELSDENRMALYIPPGFAHGFQTLTDRSEVFYQMTESYDPRLARGFRWDDPEFSIAWPIGNPTLSERDRSYPDFAGMSRE